MPPDWSKAMLGDFSEPQRGLTYSAATLSDTDGLPYINLKSFTKGGGLRVDGTKRYRGPYKDSDLVTTKHLLLANTDLTPTGDVIGAPALLSSQLAGTQVLSSHHVSRIELPNSVSAPFVAAVLTLPSVRNMMRSISAGTTVLNLSKPFLRRVEIPLPPIAEQRRIAEILDTIDETIRKTEQLIAKLKQVKQGLLYDLLTRGIDDNGELRDPERHPEQFKDSDLGRIPRGWNVSRMEDLTSRIVDGVHRTPTYVEAGIPFLTVENLTRGPSISFEPCRFVSIAAHREYIRRADPQAGDVLVSKDGTLGVARLVPPGLPEFSIFVSVAILRPRLDRIVPALIETFFDTPLFQRQLGTQSAGTGLKHIHLEHFREFRIAVPSLAEQARIFEAVGGLRLRLTTEDSTLLKLRRLKCGLMDDLLTGRIRVTSLHNDAAA